MEKISIYKEKIDLLKKEIWKKIIWQNDLIENVIICFLSWGHIILEWVPWLAKTLLASSFSQTLDLKFNRIQFTPDLLPSDLLWTEIFNMKTSDFDIKKWPIFSNFVLADEINRAPSKVQSALLEAMAEKTVTIWNETFFLEKHFLVLATQNPLEQSGTYKLPEAQLDRFMMKINVSYPDFEAEKTVYKNIFEQEKYLEKILSKDDISELKKIVSKIYVSDDIFDYIVKIIDSTRFPEKYWLENLKKYIDFWASPRWWISLIKGAKALAFLNWRDFVIPEDIKKIAINILQHRIILSYEAIVDEIDEKKVINEILKNISIK